MDMSICINNVIFGIFYPEMFVHNVYEHAVSIITNINDIV